MAEVKENETPHLINEITHKVETGKVKLSIIFGNGQKGNSAFKDLKGKYRVGSVTNYDLGSSDEVKNKSLLISSIATDISPDTNSTIITYLINGSPIGSFQQDASNDNGSVFYSTTLKFK